MNNNGNRNENIDRKTTIVTCCDISKEFIDANLSIKVFSDINFDVSSREIVAIIGPSGSGKSTLLHILGTLDKQTAGFVKICGVDTNDLSEKEKNKLRNEKLGFVYQFHHLLPEFTALENVCMPLLIGDLCKKESSERANDVLKTVGLSHRTNHFIGELSGGERQRVAIARALINNPACVMADEPTGNLDHKTAMDIYDLILSTRDIYGTTFIIVSHDGYLSKIADKIFVMQDGQLCVS